MAIRVVARDHFKPESEEAVVELMKELVAQTRLEEGNISYLYTKDVANPGYYAMIECWKSQEALDAHTKSEHFTRIIPQLGAMAVEPTRIEIYEELL